MDPSFGGSVVRTAATTPNKTRQRGRAILTLSLAIIYFIYLLDSIVTSFLFLCPTRNTLPVLPTIPIINVSSYIVSGNLHGSCLELEACCCTVVVVIVIVVVVMVVVVVHYYFTQ